MKFVLDLSFPEGHPDREKMVPLTAEEIADMEQAAAEAEAQRLANEALAQAKAEAQASAEAKLAALGLTAEEISALIQ
jgi:hypothetical protein